ncbi:MAG TPA: AraC family transcriptional regulator [Mycobacterium sp.]
MDQIPESLAGGFLIDADSVEQIEEQIGAAFGAIRIHSPASRSPTRTRVWRSHLGVLSVDDAEYSFDMSYEMAAPDDILLCRVHAGVLEETDPRQPHSHGTGAVVAFGAVAERPFAGRVHKARYHILNVPRWALTQVAGNHPDGEPVHLTGSTPLSPAANRYLVDVVDHIRHGLLSNPYTAQEPLAASGVTRYLASSMLAALPHTVGDEARQVADADNYDALRRATAFIDDNAHKDISPADIAYAARVPTRVLEEMFRRHRGCSATQYLQHVRLSCVYHDLMTGTPP